MELQLPEHLFSNEELSSNINQETCDNCRLLRRSKYIQYPTNELDTSIWSSKDIYGLSINIYLCNIDSLKIESKIDDVKYVCFDEKNIHFSKDEQRNGIDISKITAIFDKNIILQMIFGEIRQLKGKYPFGQAGSEDYQEFEYKLVIQYKPLLFNPFHFEIAVYSSEDDFREPLERSNLKGYQKSLASDIRNRILLEKLITPV